MINKGFFSIVIIALLLILAISIIGSIIKINIENNKTTKELIEIKDLVYFRTEFEYNLKNIIKTNLDNEILITQNQTILKTNTDLLVKQLLQEYNIPSALVSNLLVNVFECGLVNCAHYRYSILYPISKTISKADKEITLKIPIDYTIENTLVVP